MSAVQEYCQLASLTSSKITLIQQGLYCLEQYDDVVVMTVQGDFANQNFQHQDQNAIWISRYPQYNHEIKRYVVLLKLSGKDQSAKALGHQLCAYISTIILLVNYDRTNIRHISIESSQYKDKTAALVGFMENSQTLQMISTDQKFRDYLDDQNIKINGYPSCDGFQFTYIQTEQKWKLLLSSLKSILESPFGSNELLHGHIIKQYAQNLSEQQKKMRKMNPVKAEQDIQIDEQFEEYLSIIGKYNGRCKNRLGNHSEENIGYILKDVREQIETERLFEDNGYYAQKLQKYMNRKENEITKLNEQYQDAQNLQILQEQSNKLLKKVKKEKKQLEKKDVDNDLKKMIEKYDQKAKGKNKHRLLSDYLQLFTPTLYEEAGVNQKVDHQLRKYQKENQDLEQEIKKMQKKGSKCCTLM